MPAPSQIQNVERRAIRIQPQIVTLLNPQSMNIISQHVAAPADQRFDLVVATNIFLYYDRFELALALLNVESMLSSGGLLLTNDAIEDYAGVKLRTVGSASVQYTPSQADTVRIYSIPRFQPQIAPA
jgi:chemotaxis methyl-accepting protein methylase